MGGQGEDVSRVKGDWLKSRATQGLFDLYDAAGYQLYFVGGCVRNALLGEEITDIDMASDAPPEAAIRFLEAAGERVIPTGVGHGTITVVRDGIPHEITTFRKDVETDGRRAVVSYAASIEEDSLRRDFTINALYADRAGRVLDPQNGLQDIADRRVRFIENAEARMREDYLRILRFFRFHARYATTPIAADTLDAIARAKDGLSQLSAERITGELIKLLSVPDPAPTVAIMKACGVLQTVLPGADDRFFAPLVHMESQLNLHADAATRLAALGGADTCVNLRLSNHANKAIEAIREGAGGSDTPAVLSHKLGATQARKALALRHAMLTAPLNGDEMQEISRGAKAEFPIKSSDLMGAYRGRELGDKLNALLSKWYASDLKLTKQQLLG